VKTLVTYFAVSFPLVLSEQPKIKALW